MFYGIFEGNALVRHTIPGARQKGPFYLIHFNHANHHDHETRESFFFYMDHKNVDADLLSMSLLRWEK